jgi:tetratricopeptide (TPR) repeat protein
MRIIVLVVLFVIGCFYATFGQTTLPDSIENQYAGDRKDSTYINALNEQATEFLKSNPTLSRRISFYTADLAPKLNYVRGYARALTVIGNSYWHEGVYEYAQNYYLLAARQYQSIRDSLGLGKVYNNIGEVNKRFGEYQKALDYFQQSINLRKGDTTVALTLYNIGEVYLVTRQYEQATTYINKSLDEAKRFKDDRSITYCYWSIARIKMAQGQFAEALPYFRLAEVRWTQLGETRILIQTYHDMAEVYRKMSQTRQARMYLDKAFSLGKTIQVPDLRVQTYLGYSQLDSIEGNFGAALKFLFLHNQLKDSVYNILKAEQIARVQIIYETERRQRENEQLKADKEMKEQQLNSKESWIAVITSGLLVVILLASVLFRQRSQILKRNRSLHEKNDKIRFQKEAIEAQAVVMIKLNEELQNLNKTLAGRIEERSKQLLLQNQKLAEYSFVNAHKLRAPVASILGLIQLLDQPELTERDLVLAHLKTCAIQLDHIIQEISKNLATDNTGFS